MNDETIFATALEKPNPTERAAYVAEACAGSPEQRKRIEALLAAHDKASGFLERPAVEAAELPDSDFAPTRAFPTPNTDSGDGPTPTLDGDSAGEGENNLGFLATPQRPDSLGRIGHYEVLEVLGRGGFGIVFRAFDDALQRVVAVKVLSPALAATSPARKRFIREARSAAAIQHEHVVRIYDTGEQPLPYLVMEFVPGETLQQRFVRTGPLDVSETVRIARQIAEGLAAAHEKGLVHRDIKPANILIERAPQERAKITDFGLARAADDASLTRSGVVAGTPMYMAPEQAKGESLDHRADLFSLGSVLYAMLTGRPPFRASSAVAVLKRVCDEDPRPIREVIPEVPEWLCRIVEKLHAKEPAERFQTAREVAELLADCEKQLQTHQEVKNLARIPEAKPAPRRAGRIGNVWKWAAAAAAIMLVLLFVPCVMVGFYFTSEVKSVDAERSKPIPPAQPDLAKPLAVAPFTDADVKRIAALPAEEQIQAVAAELKKRNPNFDGRLAGIGGTDPIIENGEVIEVALSTDQVTDISPLRAFTKLEQVSLAGSKVGGGRLTSLAPLAGLPLKQVYCRNNPGLTDLSPLEGLSLDLLACTGSGVKDLKTLSAKSVRRLDCSLSQVPSEERLNQLAVEELRVWVQNPVVSAPALRTLGPRLKVINGRPADEVLAAAEKELPPVAVPFSAAKAKEYQEAWAKQFGEKEVEFADKTLGMKFRVIPPGEFMMGSKEDDLRDTIANARVKMPPGWQFYVRSLESEIPEHKVRITRPYAIGTYEVTVEQFRKFVDEKKYKSTVGLKGGWGYKGDSLDKLVQAKEFYWDNVGYEQPNLAPVWNVSRDDAMKFCEWLSEKEGRTFRLPTEAEWEYACRAGTDTRTFWAGDRNKDSLPYAWGAGKGKGQPQAVGQLQPNPFGLRDICGNVWEWCSDWYDEGYYREAAKKSLTIDPRGPDGPAGGGMTRHPVMRGGGVGGGHYGISSTARSAIEQKLVGFRVVCELAEPKEEPREQPDEPQLEPKPMPPLAVLQPLRDAVAARGRTVEDVKKRLEAGTVSKLELLAAQVDLCEANIKLTEAEADEPILILHLRELVKLREEERDLIRLRVEVGKDLADALNQANARLADAKARLAKVRPPAVAPPPREK